MSLLVEPWEFLGIIGPNGGGKTTLLKMMLGLLKPQKGTVRVFGKPPSQVRTRIGYVPQRAAIDPTVPASVLDVVLTGRLSRSSWGPYYREEDIAAALEALRQTETAELARRSIATLSGGQRQRVLIARALASERRLLSWTSRPPGSIRTWSAGVTDLLHRLNETLPIVIVSHDVSFLVAPEAGGLLEPAADFARRAGHFLGGGGAAVRPRGAARAAPGRMPAFGSRLPSRLPGAALGGDGGGGVGPVAGAAKGAAVIQFFIDLPVNGLLPSSLVAGLLASLACGLIGPYVITRRIVFLSGAIRTWRWAGSARRSSWPAFFPRPSAGSGRCTARSSFALAGAVTIGLVRRAGHRANGHADRRTRAVGMAIGLLLLKFTPGYNTELMSYLFGSISFVNWTDVRLMVFFNAAIFVTVLIWHKRLLAVCLDQEQAELQESACWRPTWSCCAWWR